MVWEPSQDLRGRALDDPYFGLRMTLVEQVNRDRASAGVAAVEFDALCSDVADAHCQEMAEAQYLSHWNQRGQLPYHRYHAAGGRDYVAENLSRTSVISLSPNPIPTDPDELLPMALAAHERFMAERPPLDGHRLTVLDAAHTHVGIGLAVVDGEFMLAQLFLNRYVRLNPLPAALPPALPATAPASSQFRVEGDVLTSGYGPYYAAVFYEGELRPRTAIELDKTYSYEDMNGTMIQKIPPWEMQFNAATQHFQFMVRINPRTPGLYHFVLWVRRPFRDIPYKLTGPGAYTVDTSKGTLCASWVFRA